MSVPSKILLVGATGAIGRYITNAIVSVMPSTGQEIAIFTSAATTSSPSKSELLSSWKSKGVKVITGDITNANDVTRAYEGVDTVVSCLGRNALASQIELLRIAEESNSVKWFFPSEYGTDIEYDNTSKDEKPHQNKLKVRAFIRENIKKVKCTYIVTGPYADMFFQLRNPVTGGYDVQEKRAVVIGDGEGRVGLTTMPDVGKLVVAALQHPEESEGKVLKVQSFVVSPNQILEEFEKQTGRDWKVDRVSHEALRDEEKSLWDAGNPTATGATLRRIWAEGGTLYEKTDNGLLGLSPQDMEPLSAVVERYSRAVRAGTAPY
ncbi:NAD(P)-binding protein [Xylariaceae sp. FL1019]|nr:NAD(P)-binding protein [Xylariaceae sp. FL1019]